jgi:predicted nucleic acid-binding protein
MPVRVIDASALAAVLFGEPDGERVAELIADHSLVAPTLLPFEIANTCFQKIRRHPVERDKLLAALGVFARLDVALAPIDSDAVVRLAEKASLTAYDASYLWLAHELGAELVTLDTALTNASTSFR